MIGNQNIAFNDRIFNVRNSSSNSFVKIDDVVNKTFVLFLILVFFAYVSFTTPALQNPLFMFGSIIIGLIIAVILMFNQKIAYILAPIYSVVQGIFLGSISFYFEGLYSGIILQAVIATLCVFFTILFLYKAKIIRATPLFRKVILIGIFSVMGIYLVSFIMSFFGTTIPYIHGNGPIGILFSLVVVTIAAFTLILDFDFIENASKNKAPKYLEWYCGFALLVTIIWLYIEILKLLAKLRSQE